MCFLAIGIEQVWVTFEEQSWIRSLSQVAFLSTHHPMINQSSLQSLPVELQTIIYLFSLNWQMSKVCRRFNDIANDVSTQTKRLLMVQTFLT
jgi:hypothetical protein